GEFHGDDVRAGVRLGHRQRTNVLAAHQLGQVLALLLFGAVAVNLVDAQVGVGAVGQTNRGGGAADFLHGNHVCQVAHPGSAVFFFHGNTQQAHIAKLPPQVHGELVVTIDFRGAGGDFGCSETVH